MASQDRVADSDLSLRSKKHMELWAGFCTGKGLAREDRVRAKAVLGSVQGLSDDFRDQMVRAGLSESLLCVLSEKPLAEIGGAPIIYGSPESRATILLDERASLRAPGYKLLFAQVGEKPTEEKRHSGKALPCRDLSPFLAHLPELPLSADGAKASAPTTRAQPARLTRTAQPKDALHLIGLKRAQSR
jgi:hypothetical protein